MSGGVAAGGLPAKNVLYSRSHPYVRGGISKYSILVVPGTVWSFSISMAEKGLNH